MHRRMRDQLEEVLEGRAGTDRHLQECGECREEAAAMREQSAMLHSLRVPNAEPPAGFYARVMERVERQRPNSIWSLFFDSAIGHRIAMASVALALLMGAYVVSSEERGPEPVPMTMGQTLLPYSALSNSPQEVQPGIMLTGAPNQDAVLLNLVTYREQ